MRQVEWAIMWSIKSVQVRAQSILRNATALCKQIGNMVDTGPSATEGGSEGDTDVTINHLKQAF
jgi:hypothetical protein